MIFSGMSLKKNKEYDNILTSVFFFFLYISTNTLKSQKNAYSIQTYTGVKHKTFKIKNKYINVQSFFFLQLALCNFLFLPPPHSLSLAHLPFLLTFSPVLYASDNVIKSIYRSFSLTLSYFHSLKREKKIFYTLIGYGFEVIFISPGRGIYFTISF